MARVTTGNPSSHLAHSPAIITNRFITRSALWLSRHLYSPPLSEGLRKCLDVKFKQHKCLPAKQSSSESCGTQSSLFGVGGEGWCGSCSWVSFFFFQAIQPLHDEAESPGSCIVLWKVFSSWGKQHLKLTSVAQLLSLSLTSSTLVPFSLRSRLIFTSCCSPWTFFPLLLCLHLVQRRT